MITVRKVADRTWELRFSTSAPVAKAFDYVVDFERHTEWEEDVFEVRHLSGTPRSASAAYLKTYGQRPTGFIQRFFWQPTRIDCTLKEVQRPHRIAWQQQLWRDQTSESYYRQDVELLISESAGGSELVFTRHLMGDDAISADLAMKMYGRMSPVLNQMSPEMKEQFREMQRSRSRGRPMADLTELTPDEVAGDIMENLPIKGPGSRSLARLKAVLDGINE